MDRIWQQCRKELIGFARDPLTVAMTFILPVVTLLIYGFAIRLETKNVQIIVQDVDRTPLSRDYADRLFATNQFEPRAWDGRDPEEALRSGAARAVIVIPPGFERELKEGKPADVQAVVDGSEVANARVIRSSVRATSDFFNTVNGLSAPPNLSVASRIWFNPGREEALFIVPGAFAVVLSIFPALLAGINIGREKDQGTIVQAYASSISALEFLLGKCTAFVLINVGAAALLMVIGAIIWHLRFAGDPTPLFIVTPIFMTTIIMLGILLGVIGRDQNTAMQAIGTIQPLITLLFSGFLYPINNIPFPISLLAFAVPPRYYMEVTRDAFVRGSGWGGVWQTVPILTLIAVVELGLAWLAIRRMQLPG